MYHLFKMKPNFMLCYINCDCLSSFSRTRSKKNRNPLPKKINVITINTSKELNLYADSEKNCFVYGYEIQHIRKPVADGYSYYLHKCRILYCQNRISRIICFFSQSIFSQGRFDRTNGSRRLGEGSLKRNFKVLVLFLRNH